MRQHRTAWISNLLLGIACCAFSASASPTAPASNSDFGEVAVVATKDGLVRFNINDKSTTKLSPDPISWCAVDNRAQVVWYLTQDFALKLIDLTAGAAPITIVPRTKIRASTPTIFPIISYGKIGSIGDELATFSPMIRLQLEMQAQPKLTAVLQCDGDASWYCYKSADGNAEPAINDEVAKTLADVRQLPLQEVAKLAALAQRGGDRPLWRTSEARNLPDVAAVPKTGCAEDLGGCGAARAIPGIPYWSVSVASSRGDFAHETQQFYDPLRKRFFDPLRPGISSPKPLAGEHAVASMFIAGSGRHLLMNGAVISFEKGVLLQGTRACGFIGASWFYQHPFP